MRVGHRREGCGKLARQRGRGEGKLGHPRRRSHRLAGANLGHTLLEQHLGRLDKRLGVKASLHHVIVERIRKREQAHALVVGHK